MSSNIILDFVNISFLICILALLLKYIISLLETPITKLTLPETPIGVKTDENSLHKLNFNPQHRAALQEILTKHKISIEFPSNISESYKKESWNIEKEISSRKDLRKQTIFSIDAPNTTDIDDAFSCSLNQNGNFVVGIHIADPTFYIPRNSPLDLMARKRSSSIYLHSKVIPMLPHIFSDDICSLLPNKDRLAITTTFTFSQEGELLDFSVARSIIRSSMNLTYEEAQSIIDRPNEGGSHHMFTRPLKRLNDIAKKLKEKRVLDSVISPPDIS